MIYSLFLQKTYFAIFYQISKIFFLTSHQSLGMWSIDGIGGMCGILISGMCPMKMSIVGGRKLKLCCGMKNPISIGGICGENIVMSGTWRCGSPHCPLKASTPASKPCKVPSTYSLKASTYHEISSCSSVLTSVMRSKIGRNGHCFFSGQFSWTFWTTPWIWSLMLAVGVAFFASNFISKPSCMAHTFAPSSTKRPI